MDHTNNCFIFDGVLSAENAAYASGLSAAAADLETTAAAYESGLNAG